MTLRQKICEAGANTFRQLLCKPCESTDGSTTEYKTIYINTGSAVSGSISHQTISANIEPRGVSGSIEAQTVSGNIEVDDNE